MMLDDTTLRILACQIDVPSMTTSAERDAHLRTSAVKVRKELAKGRVRKLCVRLSLSLLKDKSRFGIP